MTQGTNVTGQLFPTCPWALCDGRQDSEAEWLLMVLLPNYKFCVKPGIGDRLLASLCPCGPFRGSPSPPAGPRLKVPPLHSRPLFSAVPEAANPWRAAPAGFSGARSVALFSIARFVPALGTLRVRDFPVQSFITTSENSH